MYKAAGHPFPLGAGKGCRDGWEEEVLAQPSGAPLQVI